ncbi:MAG TPA: response regulator [Burkholderiales bacterium]|nr:response regulator [Burkholderiales bacterium]
MPPTRLVAIVDDDASIRGATRSFLRAAGYATATFGDAESFLGSSARAGTACLVTDMKMPGMSGLELCEALIAAGDPIPTVLITAYAEEVVQARARKSGIQCCLTKPFAPEQLLECVREALATRGGAGPIPKS